MVELKGRSHFVGLRAIELIESDKGRSRRVKRIGSDRIGRMRGDREA